MHKGCLEWRASCLAFAVEFAQNDHAISSVNEILGDEAEICVVCRDLCKDAAGYSLDPPMHSGVGIARTTGLVPLDVGVHRPKKGGDITSPEGFVQILCQGNIFLRHTYSSSRCGLTRGTCERSFR